MTGVSAATEHALESALDRLLSGQPLRTDGALTVAGLARGRVFPVLPPTALPYHRAFARRHSDKRGPQWHEP